MTAPAAVKRSPAERLMWRNSTLPFPPSPRPLTPSSSKGPFSSMETGLWRTAIPRQPQCPVFLSAETPTAVLRILSMRSTRQKWRPPELTSIWAGQVSWQRALIKRLQIITLKVILFPITAGSGAQRNSYPEAVLSGGHPPIWRLPDLCGGTDQPSGEEFAGLLHGGGPERYGH